MTVIDPDQLPNRTRLVLAAEDIFDLWGTRTLDGERIIVEWGERKPEGWYEPIFTRHGDDRLPDAAELDRLRRIEAAAEEALALLESVYVDAGPDEPDATIAALRAALAEGSAGTESEWLGPEYAAVLAEGSARDGG